MTLILDPGLAAAEKKDAIVKVKKLLETAKGKVEKTDEWGKKTFVYPIRKFGEGDYHFWEVSLPESGPAEIDKKMRLENEVLRYLLVRKE